MKFDPTTRQLILLALLLGTVVGTHVFAPGAVSAITSIVSTVFGALFVNLREAVAAKTEPLLAPVLALVPPPDPEVHAPDKDAN